MHQLQLTFKLLIGFENVFLQHFYVSVPIQNNPWHYTVTTTRNNTKEKNSSYLRLAHLYRGSGDMRTSTGSKLMLFYGGTAVLPALITGLSEYFYEVRNSGSVCLAPNRSDGEAFPGSRGDIVVSHSHGCQRTSRFDMHSAIKPSILSATRYIVYEQLFKCHLNVGRSL